MKTDTFAYIAMKQLGKTLQQHFVDNNLDLSTHEICNIALSLLTQFERLHSLGKVHNDLNLNNVLVGDRRGNKAFMDKFTLIDYGLCTDFLEEDGKHV